jgi:hypothetical protein
MKAILEFDLDDHEDRIKHLRAVRSDDAFLCLFDIQTKLKKEIEQYQDYCSINNKDLSKSDIIEKTIEIINEIYEHNDLSNIEHLTI